MKQYQYESPSLDGFVQRIVVLSQKGYYYFLNGTIPAGRDLIYTDQKLLEKSVAWVTKDQRYLRKQQGKANAHYFRHDRDWAVMLTDGAHPMRRENQKERLLDLRNEEHPPLYVGGYSIKLRRDGTPEGQRRGKLRAAVRIDDDSYSLLKARFLELCLRRPSGVLAASIYNVPFEPYAPVYRQMTAIVKAMNERRAKANMPEVPLDSVRFMRTLPKHFQEVGDDGVAAYEAELDSAAQGKKERGPGCSGSSSGSPMVLGCFRDVNGLGCLLLLFAL